MTSKHALDEINAVRDRQGLSPFLPNEKLDLAAIHHVEWMTRNGLSHSEGLWGPNLEKRLDNAGFNWKACAENIAFGQRTVREVLESWLFSPGHRQNVLGDYQSASLFSCPSPSGNLYWILVLGTE